MHDALFDVAGCTVRLLKFADVPALQDLIERCADYLLLAAGQAPQPNAGASLLFDRPPATALDDKIIIGFCVEPDRLVGVLDAVRNYPETGIWYIGLMLMEPAYRNRGLGASIVQAFQAWSGGHGAHALRLGVYEQNVKGQSFWQRMGFVETERCIQHFGVLDNVCITLQCELRREA